MRSNPDTYRNHPAGSGLQPETFSQSTCTKGLDFQAYLTQLTMNIAPYVSWVMYQERKFGCEHCGKRFRTKTDFRRHHDVVHLKLKRFTCRTCGNRFGVRGNLTKHEKRHAGIRNYKCEFPECQASFVLRDGLLRHQRSVHSILRIWKYPFLW